MPSDALPNLRRDFWGVLLLPALTLLLIPAAGWAFAHLAESDGDRRVWASVDRTVDQATDATPEQKAEEKAFYRRNPPSKVCDTDDERLSGYRAAVCEVGSAFWQFRAARLTSGFAFGLGVLALVLAVGLSTLAWGLPRLQYVAFIVGWYSLVAITAIELVLQGALATWLSYWVTALLVHVYLLKLIALVAAAALAGVTVALKGLLTRPRVIQNVEGSLVEREQAGALWSRLEALAQRVGTRAPDSLIAGIDDNFFVTETPAQVGAREVNGRTLYVSLPLLRLLSATEADAVLAHELAHFLGGDTAELARLSPTLTRFDTFLAHLGTAHASLPAFYVLRMFRAVFEVARQRERRAREFRADQAAARATSGDDLAKALLKVTAYSSHRATTEHSLFEATSEHSTLDLKTRLAEGLRAHVATPDFSARLVAANTPHPFDSHPPLEARLQAVGTSVAAAECPALVSSWPSRTWMDDFPGAAAVEYQLWSDYEARFVTAHELALTHRYRPDTESEQALIEKHFPERTFRLKSGALILVTWNAIVVADRPRLPWTEVLSITIDDQLRLSLHHCQGSSAGFGPTAVLLSAVDDRQAFEEVVAAYWRRTQAASDWAARNGRPNAVSL